MTNNHGIHYEFAKTNKVGKKILVNNFYPILHTSFIKIHKFREIASFNDWIEKQIFRTTHLSQDFSLATNVFCTVEGMRVVSVHLSNTGQLFRTKCGQIDVPNSIYCRPIWGSLVGCSSSNEVDPVQLFDINCRRHIEELGPAGGKVGDRMQPNSHCVRIKLANGAGEMTRRIVPVSTKDVPMFPVENGGGFSVYERDRFRTKGDG